MGWSLARADPEPSPKLANRPAIFGSIRIIMTTKTTLLSGLLRLVVAVGLTGVTVVQSGCLIVAAGAAAAGTVMYVRGELQASLANPYPAVITATGEAIEKLQFRKISEKGDALKTVIVARTGSDKKVEITVKKVTDSVTKVEIRVGVFGNEALSMTILEKIKESL